MLAIVIDKESFIGQAILFVEEQDDLLLGHPVIHCTSADLMGPFADLTRPWGRPRFRVPLHAVLAEVEMHPEQKTFGFAPPKTPPPPAPPDSGGSQAG